MKVFVTGGAGYIGSHTCVSLLEAGYEVVAVDNLCNSSKNVVTRVEEITGGKMAFYDIDVRERAALSMVFDSHNIDCVIHLAGLKAVGESVHKPLAYYQNNIDSTLSLAEVMRSHGVKHIIFSSSATVYSGDNPMPLREDSKTGNCTNPYGWTKFMCEQILRDLAFTDKEWSVVQLRYFNPVGAHGSGRIGEAPNGIPNNLMPFICQTAVGKLTELSIYGDDYDTPDGTGVRDYIHVVDLAEGHVAAIEYLMSHTGESIFNLGTGKPYSVLEIVHAFERVNALKIPYRIAPRRAGDLPACYADPAKSAEVLGWRAKHDIEDMCREAWRWQSKNLCGYGD